LENERLTEELGGLFVHGPTVARAFLSEATGSAPRRATGTGASRAAEHPRGPDRG
jgi:hypothetical protein